MKSVIRGITMLLTLCIIGGIFPVHADVITQKKVDTVPQQADSFSLSELDWLIDQAEKIDTSLYTEEAVFSLMDILNRARVVRSDEKASSEEIASAIKELRDVVGNIKPNPVFLFDDVRDEAKFYFDPIYWAYKHNPQISKGTSETTFTPNENCTRGQVVTFLWRAVGEPEPKSMASHFSDLKSDAFYEKAVAWAVEQGITKGTSDSSFSPDATCTRGQIVTFLYRANGSPKQSQKDNPFKDVAEGQYFTNAVLWAVENGVTKGKTADEFRPDATCTRGEVVTFLYRAMGEK